MTTHVDTLSSAGPAGYRSFVARHSQARFGHSLEWAEALRRTYGFRLEHLVSRRGDRITGVLPLFYSRSLLSGRHFVSSPFPTYAGPLFESHEALDALLAAAADKTRHVGYTLLATGDRLPPTGAVKRLEARADELTFLLPLRRSSDELFSSLRKNIRRDVRHAERQGIEVLVDATGERQKDFYRLYAATYAKKHGLPPHPRSLFGHLWSQLGPGRLRVYLARHQRRVVAAVMTIRSGGEIYYAWSAADARANLLQPTTAILWRILADGCEEGLEVFNMGEAPKEHHGLVRFKKRWCPESRESVSYCLLGTASARPQNYYGGFGWQKRLIAALPLPVTTRLLSPLLRFVV